MWDENGVHVHCLLQTIDVSEFGGSSLQKVAVCKGKKERQNRRERERERKHSCIILLRIIKNYCMNGDRTLYI